MNRVVPPTGEEKESLQAALDRHRDVLLWKIEGVSDEDLRRPMTPSGTTLLGILKHVAWVEYGWFCETFGREMEVEYDEDDLDADFRIEPDESTDDVVALFNRARVAADKAIAEIDLETTGKAWSGQDVSMRWVLIHMVEEEARHAGHMDIVRELIDGVTGDHDRDD